MVASCCPTATNHPLSLLPTLGRALVAPRSLRCAVACTHGRTRDCPHERLKMVDHRGQERVLIYGGVSRCAVHGAGTKRIGHIEEQSVDGNAAAEAEAKKVIDAPLARLRIVKEAGPEGNHDFWPNPQVLGPQAHTGGVVALTL